MPSEAPRVIHQIEIRLFITSLAWWPVWLPPTNNILRHLVLLLGTGAKVVMPILERLDAFIRTVACYGIQRAPNVQYGDGSGS